jgi:hypothetical protein
MRYIEMALQALYLLLLNNLDGSTTQEKRVGRPFNTLTNSRTEATIAKVIPGLPQDIRLQEQSLTTAELPTRGFERVVPGEVLSASDVSSSEDGASIASLESIFDSNLDFDSDDESVIRGESSLRSSEGLLTFASCSSSEDEQRIAKRKRLKSKKKDCRPAFTDRDDDWNSDKSE